MLHKFHSLALHGGVNRYRGPTTTVGEGRRVLLVDCENELVPAVCYTDARRLSAVYSGSWQTDVIYHVNLPSILVYCLCAACVGDCADSG